MTLKAIAVLFGISGIVSTAAGTSAQDSVQIGVVLPLTGDAAHWGIPPRNGAEMAVEEINNAGGVGGRRLELVIEDDRCIPRKEFPPSSA